jgi:outer membrane receptor for ferrienterochelin and colicins
MPTAHPVTAASIVAIWVALASPAGAQVLTPADQPAVADATLEQLLNVEVGTVFGASRYQQKVVDAPASVSVVTHEEIARFGYRTLADVLQGVRGFYVSNDRNYSYLGTRGFSRPGDYNSRVLFLIDGHRMNDSIYDSSYIGADFPLPLEVVERVEIVRGPSSSIYGTSAFFAVVNVVTRSAASLRGLRASVDGGSLGTRGASAVYGTVTGSGTALLFSGSGFASNGLSRYEVPGLGVASDMDDEQAWSFFGSATRKQWALRGAFVARDKGIPTGAFGVLLDRASSSTEDDRAYVELSYDGSWRGTGLAWRSSVDRYAYSGVYAYESTDPSEPLLFDDLAVSNWLGSELMLTRRVAKRHFLTGGVEYREHLRQDQRSGYVGEAPDLDERHASRAMAAYVQDEFTLSRYVTLNAGVRHDLHSDWKGSTNVRAAVIVKPVANAALKILHGNAFRAPNQYELFYYQSPEPLAPERIRTSEIVWEQYLQRRVRVSISGFTYTARDLISQVALSDLPGDLGYVNLEQAEATGLELEAEGVWRENQLVGSYTFQNVQSHPDHQRLSNSPRHMWRGRVTGPLFARRLFFGLETLYTGDRQTLGGSIADGALLGNLTLTSGNLGSATLSLTVGNLLNRAHVDPGAEEHPGDVIAQPGRTIRARLAWRF